VSWIIRIGNSYWEVEFLKPFSERVISNPFSIMAAGIVTSGLPTNRIPHSRAKGFGESI
jgi:hypothetical protein